MNETIKVLVVDDHTFYREGVRAMLKDAPEIEVIGEAINGEQAVTIALEQEPDVILMDLKMPDLNGVEATRQILHSHPHIAILVVTMFEDNDSVFAAMRAGARGYLLKDAGREELVRAIQAVSRGEAIFSPVIARRLMHYFRVMGAAWDKTVLAFPELTVREREILELIAHSESNDTIAHKLGLSLKTVQNNVSNIFSKLQVADRAQAIVRAREAGLG